MSRKLDTNRRRRAARLLGGLLVALFFVAVGIVVVLAIVFIRSCGSGPAQEVTVPAVVSLAVEEAEHKLNELNLGLRVVDSTFSNEEPAGAVIKQQPPAGSRVREGRIIEVVRSLGKQSLITPDLIGTSLVEAQRKLASAKLPVGTVKKVHLRKYKRGEVIRQNPQPGEVFNSPVKVDLTVACADPECSVSVPLLVGQSLYVAERMLHNADLIVSSVNYMSSPVGEPGQVLEQSPEAGTSAQPGAGLDLTVNVPGELLSRAVHHFQFRFRLPSSLPGGELKLVTRDELGQSVVFRDKIETGETVEQILSVQGKAIIQVYFEGKLIREDKI